MSCEVRRGSTVQPGCTSVIESEMATLALCLAKHQNVEKQIKLNCCTEAKLRIEPEPAEGFHMALSPLRTLVDFNSLSGETSKCRVEGTQY